LAQFYTLAGSTGFTVTLPTPSSTINGTYVVFKRTVFGTNRTVTFTVSPSAAIFYDDNSATAANSVAMVSDGDEKKADLNGSFICDSTNWYKIHK
jgi:hypothetical protein